MPVAKRHFVTRRDILAMAITLTEARAADLSYCHSGARAARTRNVALQL
jgi:protein tyrosine phosphatase (PTP) superfamily phosphohydrolase (DUF442 family)